MKQPRRPRRGWIRTGLLMLPLMQLLTGCWDRRDPERVAWVTAIGVDKGPRNDYIFSFQVPQAGGGPGRPGGAGGGTPPSGPEGALAEVFAIEAPDIITALDASQSFVARRVVLTHAKAVIVGDEVARTNVTPIIGAATRFQEFRRNMMIMVARGTAYEFLRMAQPRMEASTARWFELLMMTQAEAGIIPMSRIHEFVLEKETPGVGAVATLVAARPDIAAGTASLDAGGQERTEGTPPTAGSVSAGEVRRLRELPVEVMGAAVFKGSKVAGYLTGDESRLVSMLRGDMKRAAMAFIDPAEPERRVVFRLKPQAQTKLRVTRSGNRVHGDFTVNLEGDLVTVQSQTNYTVPENQARLEAAVSGELKRRMEAVLDKTLHQWGTDLYYIANHVRGTLSTIDEWERFDWGEKVFQTTYSVHVQFRMRRHGMQTEPALPKE